MNYRNKVSRVTNIISKDTSDWILIGENSSGKSEILKEIVKQKKDVYFIDTVNRRYNVDSVDLVDKGINVQDIKQIVEARINEYNHNIKDSFGESNNIERSYTLYSDKLRVLLKEFLKIDFEVISSKMEGVVLGPKALINGSVIDLSSGYQSIIRLFSELIIFYDYYSGRGTVVIDEIDEFISPKYSAKIFNYLREEFDEVNFVISTHSADLVAFSNKANIMSITDDSFSVVDCDDFATLTSVNTLFENVFNSLENDIELHSQVEKKLYRLFDLKMNDTWNEIEQNEFAGIDYTILTPTQKVIFKHIQEW